MRRANERASEKAHERVHEKVNEKGKMMRENGKGKRQMKRATGKTN